MISKKFDVSIDYLMGLSDKKDKLHTYELKSSEMEQIKKYRTLDEYGKDMVDTVLDKEYKRAIKNTSDKPIVKQEKPVYRIKGSIAARGNSEIPIEGTTDKTAEELVKELEELGEYSDDIDF